MKIYIRDITEDIDMSALIRNMDAAFVKSGISLLDCSVSFRTADPTESEPDAFKQTIRRFLKNLEKTMVDQPCDDYFAGMKNAYLYALAIYEETR